MSGASPSDQKRPGIPVGVSLIPISASVANSDLGIQIALKTGASMQAADMDRLLTWTGGVIYLTQSDKPEPIFKIFKIRKCSYLKVIRVNPFGDIAIN
jgi:hypothetical protein